MKIDELQYRGHTIRYGKIKRVGKALAYRTGIKGPVDQAEADTPEKALESIKVKLDTRLENRRAKRRQLDGSDFEVPTVEEYLEALDMADLSKAQRDMLMAHADSGSAGMTAGQLAEVAGYKDFSAANAHYGKAGRKIGDAIGINAPASSIRDGDVATGILADGGKPRPNGSFVWVMHPELREAVIGKRVGL